MSLIFWRPEINSLKELASNSNYELALVKGSGAETMFKVFINQHFLVRYNCLNKNKQNTKEGY